MASLGPLDPNLVLSHTQNVTNQIGQLGQSLSQQRLQAQEMALQNQRGNRAVGVQEGQLRLAQQGLELQKQQMQAKQQFDMQLKEAARGGTESIKKFYMQNGMFKEAQDIEQGMLKTQNMQLENVKMFNDIENSKEALALSGAINEIVAASGSPKAQKYLYNNLRTKLRKQGVDLPEEMTPGVMLALSEKATNVQKSTSAIMRDPNLRKTYGDTAAAIFSPEGQRDIQARHDSYLSDFEESPETPVQTEVSIPTGTAPQATQMGYDVNNVDPRYQTSTGKNTQDPNQRLTPSELTRAQAEAGLVDTNTLTDAEYKRAFGEDAYYTKKEADRLERRNVLVEAGMNPDLVDRELQKVEIDAKPLNINKTPAELAQYQAAWQAYNEASVSVQRERNFGDPKTRTLRVNGANDALQQAAQNLKNVEDSINGIRNLEEQNALQSILDNPNASESEKSAAIAAMSRERVATADRQTKLELERLKANNALQLEQEKLKVDQLTKAEKMNELGTTAKNKLEESVISLEGTLSELDSIMEDLTPETLTYFGRGEQFYAEVKDKADQFSEEEFRHILSAERIKPALGRMLATYVKNISGASVNENEFKRLSESMVNPNLGPEQLKIRAQLLQDSIKLEILGKRWRRERGFNADFSEELKAKRAELKAKSNVIFEEDAKELRVRAQAKKLNTPEGKARSDRQSRIMGYLKNGQ